MHWDDEENIDADHYWGLKGFKKKVAVKIGNKNCAGICSPHNTPPEKYDNEIPMYV